jgi:hypothetical protein
MAATKHNVLRKIAENELSRFGDLTPELKRELATSLVRQWITTDGHAGLVTWSNEYWFRLERKPDGGFGVNLVTCMPTLAGELRHCRVPEGRA